MEEFKKLGLTENTLKVLEKKGFSEPTSIQAQAIPILLNGEFDVVAQSQTGTGKTAAFGLPILERIESKAKHVQALVLAPTRELAMQVAAEIDSLKSNRNHKVLAVYGGAPIQTQISKLRAGIDIVVGTPGRVMDLENRRVLKLESISYVVLDEADEMLNMGFLDDIKDILGRTNPDKKTLLFSATMPREIINIAKKFMREYKLIKVESKHLTIDLTDQIYYDILSRDRFEGLRRIIDLNPDFYGIIFCKTKVDVDNLADQLLNANYNAAAIHGDISQGQREKILHQFKKNTISILVATDVAARGIDVNDLTHVVNYSLPQSPETYVHRIGRTGRAGKKGTAITFVTPSEKRKLKFIEKIVKQRLIKGKLPSVQEVIDTKKDNVKLKIKSYIEANESDKWEELTKELQGSFPVEKIISSLLNFAFQKELGKSNYKDIRALTEEDSSRGRSSGRGDSRRSSGRGDSRRSFGGRSSGRSSGGRSSGRSEGRDSDRSGGRDRRSKSSDREPRRNRSESGSRFSSREGSERGRSSGRSEGSSSSGSSFSRSKRRSPRRD